jgi:ubiquinone/menaquinone biosynthesis C-methylase UbiE
VERRAVDEAESRRANGPDWDRYADEYQATHGEFLGDAGFVWGPEGLTEAEAGVLGDVAGRDVLEVGSGAGQCSRWIRAQGGRSVGLDLSLRQLQHSRRIDEVSGISVPSVLGTATELPFADGSFDVVTCAHVVKHLDDASLLLLLNEIRRVLTDGGIAVLWEFAPTRSRRLNAWNELVITLGVRDCELRSYTTLSAFALEAGFEWISNAHLRPFIYPPIPRVSLIMGKAPIGWDDGHEAHV